MTTVATEDDPTLELPAVDPPPAAPAAGEPAPPAEPPAPVRTIVIGDRDGLTEPASSALRQPVPPAVPNARRGKLVFGDVQAAAGLAGAPVGPGGVDGLDGPPLVIGPPAPPGAGTPRTVIIGDADEAPPEAAIDPRIKERRKRVLRSAGLRRLRWVLLALAVVGLLVGFDVTLRSPLFDVRVVTVTGTSYIEDADLAPVRNGLVGTPLVSVDLGAVRRRIEENVWVRTVDVSRDWPHTIRIDIEERRPVAYYPGDDGLIHLVDLDGRVLATLEGVPTQFVAVEGVSNSAGPGEDAPDSLLPAIRVANDLPETLRGDVRTVRVVQQGVALDLLAGGAILLGDATDLRAKLVSALAVRGQCPPGSYKVLDIRVPSRPAVTPKDGCNGSLNATKP